MTRYQLPRPKVSTQTLRGCNMNLSYGASGISQGRNTTRITYSKIKYPVKQSGNCPVCGKRRTRSTTLTTTVNPFNTDPATGKPRTPAQVRESLKYQADKWRANFTCAACEVAS